MSYSKLERYGKLVRISFVLFFVFIGLTYDDLYASSESKKIIKKNIEEAMDRLLNEPELLDIKMGNISIKKSEVFVQKVDIKLKNATFDHLNIDDGIMVFDSMLLNKKELIDNKRIKVISSKRIDIKVEILEKSLNKYVRAKSKKIKVRNPQIRFKRDRIYLSGTFSWKLGRISFRSYGKFRVKNNKIYFRILNFKINGINLPSYLIRKTIRQVNPILDMKKFPFRTDLKYIKIKNKKMIISSLNN